MFQASAHQPALVLLGPPGAGKSLARLLLIGLDYPAELVYEGFTWPHQVPRNPFEVAVRSAADVYNLRTHEPYVVLVWLEASIRMHQTRLHVPDEAAFEDLHQVAPPSAGVPLEDWPNPQLVSNACDQLVYNTASKSDLGYYLQVLLRRCQSGYYNLSREQRAMLVLGEPRSDRTRFEADDAPFSAMPVTLRVNPKLL